MRFTIEGADARTGEERILQVEADSRADAERQARRHGILVSEIHAAVVQPDRAAEVDVIMDERFQSGNDDVGFFTPPAVPSAPTVSYRSPGASASTKVPAYLGLQIGSSVLIIFAILYYITGAILFFMAIITMAAGAAQPSPGFAVAGGVLGVIWGLTAAMVGGVLHAMSAGCVALRDMSRHIQARL